MTFRIGASGLLFFLITSSGCSSTPTPDASVIVEEDASVPEPEDLTVFVDLRLTSAGPHGDGGFLPNARRYTTMKLWVGGDAGHVIDGVSDGGRIVFDNVPTTDNVIELGSPHATLADAGFVFRFETSSRAIYLDYESWARPDFETTDAGSTLRFDLTGVTPWQSDNDSLVLYAPNAEFAREYYPGTGTNEMNDGETTATGLEFNTLDLGRIDFSAFPPIVDSSKGDELSLLQNRRLLVQHLDAGVVDRWDPWANASSTTVIARGTVPMARFTAAPAQLSSALAPLTSTQVTFDFRNDTFSAAAADLGMPANPRMLSQSSVYFEIGTGAHVYASPNPFVWYAVSRASQRIPAEPGCYPDFDGQCDAGCTMGCNPMLTTDYRPPGNLVLPVPMTHPFTEPGTEMLTYDFRISATIDVPDAGTVLVPAWNYNSLVLPSTSTVVMERALSAPQQLRVDGVAQLPSQGFTKLTFANAPTVSWAAPSLGTPNFYRLQLMEMTLRSPGNYSTTIIATVRTKATSATLPDGLLRPGHFYFIRVAAVVDPNNTDDGRQHLRTAVYRSAEAITTLFQVE